MLETLFAEDFSVNLPKWILGTVAGPLSYCITLSSGKVVCQHVDALCQCDPIPANRKAANAVQSDGQVLCVVHVGTQGDAIGSVGGWEGKARLDQTRHRPRKYISISAGLEVRVQRGLLQLGKLLRTA